jgi:hypothetical protein
MSLAVTGGIASWMSAVITCVCSINLSVFDLVAPAIISPFLVAVCCLNHATLLGEAGSICAPLKLFEACSTSVVQSTIVPRRVTVCTAAYSYHMLPVPRQYSNTIPRHTMATNRYLPCAITLTLEDANFFARCTFPFATSVFLVQDCSFRQ